MAVALAVLAGACGGAAQFNDGLTQAGDRKVNGTATSLPQPGPGAPPGQAAGASSTTTAPSGTTSTTSTRGRTVPAASQGTTRAPAPTVNAAAQAILRAASGSPGDAAGIILQPAPARTLVVEVMEEPGAAANRTALDMVLSDLRRYSGKPVSEVHTVLPAGSAGRRWSESELDALAARSARVPRGPDRFVLRLLSVKGQNARSASILAVSFRGDTFATFPDRYASTSQQIITTVTVHELGHLLGLVDLYLNRGRADTQNDPAGGGHSRSPGSVMYYAVDPSLLGSVFGSASDRFDAQDEQDLAAIRAGAPAGSNPR